MRQEKLRVVVIDTVARAVREETITNDYRAMQTIVGGMILGVERKTAAEYSFLAAVPVMLAATAYDLYKSRLFLEASDLLTFSVGFVVSFITAWFTVKWFIRLLGRYTLNSFGWYRIAVALVILWFLR